MSKIQELKAKLGEKIAALRAKVFKTPVAKAEPRPGAVRKTVAAWKAGSTGTRLLLIVMFLTLTVAVYSFVRLGIRIVERKEAFRSLFQKGSERFDKMEDFLKHQAEMKHDIASMVSIDRIRMNATLDNGQPAFFSVSIWVKCDSPKTARYVEEIFPKLHDAIISRHQLVQEHEVATEAGKEKLKISMLEAMNSVMQAGKILEVHFFNLIFE